LASYARPPSRDRALHRASLSAAAQELGHERIRRFDRLAAGR